MTALFITAAILFAVYANFALLGIAMSPALVMGGVITYLMGALGIEISNTYFRVMFFVLRFMPLIFVCIAAVALFFALLLRKYARKWSISSILETQQFDARPPILFLRPFRDDEVRLKAPALSLIGRLVNMSQSKTNLDVMLLEEGTYYGPVVAVGNPGSPIPIYGASRGCFKDGEWQESVAKLAHDSSRIIICVDSVPGVLWELSHVLRLGYAAKTLFLLHPSAVDTAANAQMLLKIVETVQASQVTPFDLNLLNSADGPILGFFLSNGTLKVVRSSEFSESSYLTALRWFFRRDAEVIHSQNLAAVH